MSETLKTGGEKSAESAGVAHLEVLTGMSGKFDPEKARSLTEQDKLQRAEKLNGEAGTERKASHLVVMSEKKEKELSPKDAANEYLVLLDELSQDFSNPYYSEERKGQSHYPNNITTELGLKYSDNPHYRWRGYASTEAGETDGTMLRIAAADAILAAEIGWRENGEKAAEEIEKSDKELDNLEAKYQKKSRLGRFLGKKKYEHERMRINASATEKSWHLNRKFNGQISRELAIAYNERGDYDYNGGDYGESQNEARNRQFFGLDDPERARKVERAIELRQKYESEWSKKK